VFVLLGVPNRWCSQKNPRNYVFQASLSCCMSPVKGRNWKLTIYKNCLSNGRYFGLSTQINRGAKFYIFNGNEGNVQDIERLKFRRADLTVRILCEGEVKWIRTLGFRIEIFLWNGVGFFITLQNDYEISKYEGAECCDALRGLWNTVPLQNTRTVSMWRQVFSLKGSR